MTWNPPGPPAHVPPPRRSGTWVRLDAVFRHPDDASETSVPDGWDLVGNVPGTLEPHSWIDPAGPWHVLAVCTFTITSADGLRTQQLRDQLVPGHAPPPRLTHRVRIGRTRVRVHRSLRLLTVGRSPTEWAPSTHTGHRSHDRSPMGHWAVECLGRSADQNSAVRSARSYRRPALDSSVAGE